MKDFVVCNTSTGEIEIYGRCRDEDLGMQAGPGAIAFESSVTHLTHYYDGNALVPYTKEQSVRKTDRPSMWSKWSNELFDWVDTRTQEQIDAAAAGQARGRRNALLAESDWTDTLSTKARLGDALYEAWQDYRQALRDITGQAGFPHQITWPVAPT